MKINFPLFKGMLSVKIHSYVDFVAASSCSSIIYEYRPFGMKCYSKISVVNYAPTNCLDQLGLGNE
jgi:hypothetical protein